MSDTVVPQGYTYPGLCVRTQSPVMLHNVDQTAVVQAFAGDLNARLTQLCGVSFQLSFKLGRPQPNLTAALQQVIGPSAGQVGNPLYRSHRQKA